MNDNKRVAWIDTVRVFACLAVIAGHYVTCFDDFKGFDKMRFMFFMAGNVGVFVFFTLSGYLIPASLERAKSLWDFYRKKLIRVVVPFTVTYIVLGSAIVLIGLLHPSIEKISPFYHAGLQNDLLWGIVPALFPVDLNLMQFLNWHIEWFVGEWFIGVLLFLYLIAPLLNKMIRRAPQVTFAASIVLSVVTFYFGEELEAQGRIVNAWWLPTARIPEFLFGMILFTYRDRLLAARKKILPAVEIWTLVVAVAFFVIYADIPTPTLISRLFPPEPRSMLLSLPVTYLLFVFVQRLNEKFPTQLDYFNGFNDISYMAMLIQHVILNVFSRQIDFGEFHTIGPPVMFIFVTITIVFAGRQLKKFSDPAESYFMNRNRAVK